MDMDANMLSIGKKRWIRKKQFNRK